MTTARPQTPLLALVGVTLAVLVWAYGNTLGEVAERWREDPQYSHGFLVPLFSVYLLWLRRGQLPDTLTPRWWGVGILLAGAGLRMAGHFLYQPWLDAGSFLVCLMGVAAAAGGRKVLAWAAPSIIFLAFMLPLPYRFQSMLGGSLQRVATEASTYVLQTLGVPAIAQGNVILLPPPHQALGVAEACSGLSMLMTFLALATAVAILAPRSLGERVLIVLSAVPIAVLANVVRIIVTALLYQADQGELARKVYHDVAGWLMMPLALGFLLFELFILGRAVVPAPGPGPGGRRLGPLHLPA